MSLLFLNNKKSLATQFFFSPDLSLPYFLDPIFFMVCEPNHVFKQNSGCSNVDFYRKFHVAILLIHIKFDLVPK